MIRQELALMQTGAIHPRVLLREALDWELITPLEVNSLYIQEQDTLIDIRDKKYLEE